MKILVQLMYIMLIVFPWLPLIAVAYFSEKVYTIQNVLLHFIMPKSPSDNKKLILNSCVFLGSIWCILFFVISLLENALSM